MAFFSLILVFIIIAVILLGGITVFGIIFLIVGHIRKKKRESAGQKNSTHSMFTTVGIFLLIIPVSIVLLILGSAIKTKIQRLSYKNVVDKWKNENVSDNVASEEAVEELLKAADNNDKDAMIALFTENIQNDPKLEEQIEGFLIEYDGGYSGIELHYNGGGSSGSSDHGKRVETLSHNYELIRDGKYYYISIDACYQNTEYPEEVGVTAFCFYSEKGRVMYNDEKADYRSGDYIETRIDVEGDFETRRVNDRPWKFYPIDRDLTREQVITAYKSSQNISELIEKIGEPNGIDVRLEWILYEIVPDENESRYAIFSYDNYGRIEGDLRLYGESWENSEYIQK